MGSTKAFLQLIFCCELPRWHALDDPRQHRERIFFPWDSLMHPGGYLQRLVSGAAAVLVHGRYNALLLMDK